MSEWRDEFDRRCRRLLGVVDDSLAVRIETDAEYEGYETFGEAYGLHVEIGITVGAARAEFADLGELIRKLEAVDQIPSTAPEQRSQPQPAAKCPLCRGRGTEEHQETELDTTSGVSLALGAALFGAGSMPLPRSVTRTRPCRRCHGRGTVTGG